MVWLILIFFIFVVGTAITFLLIGKKAAALRKKIGEQFSGASEEEKQKELVLSELATLSLGMCSVEEVQKLTAEFSVLEEELRIERGKLTIAQAEFDAMQVRIKELADVEKELETSNSEVAQEVEMLKSQEQDIVTRNSALKEELESASVRLETLITELSTSAQEVEKLSDVKAEIAEIQIQQDFYAQAIANVNAKYLELKKAYDALDIEYAHLYEKQQMAG